MSIQLWIFIICVLVIYNIYYDLNIFSKLTQYKKYYKIGLVVILGLGAMKILNNSPTMSYQNMNSLKEFIKVLPIDKNSKDLISPFLTNTEYNNTIINSPQNSVERIRNSGGKSNKRSVSETKKKYVASLQNWKCKHCQKQLTAWFEVDHKLRLEYGGTNEVNNLEALCRECHGKKTSMENM